MAHFACICIPTLGHLNPMAVVARELVRRGHKATFFHMPDVESMVRALGLDFVAVGASAYGQGELERLTDGAGQVRGAFGSMSLLRGVAKETLMLCRELPRVLRSLGVDILLVDQLQVAGGLLAHHLGLPFVSLASALPANLEQGIPPPYVGWSHGDTRWHRYRNIVGNHALHIGLKPLEDVVDSIAADWRLGRGRRLTDMMSGFAQISQLVPSLDFPRRSLIGCFHYCGPLREDDEVCTDGAPRPTGRAFASLGSLQGHRAALFEQIAKATGRQGLELTIAHGGRLPPAAAAKLARSAKVHDFVAQREILQGVDLAILHGGLNTVLDALAAGVPMVLVPLAYEQGAIASRVRRAGAGRVCRWPLLRAAQLPSLIKEVLANPAYRQAALRLREEIRISGGVTRAADILEQVAKTGQPVLNPDLV